MENLAKAERKYDRDNGEQVCKRDESEFSFDGMSQEKFDARLAKMEAVKAEVLAKLGIK